MAKAPERPEDIFGEFEKDIKDIFAEDLISLILYGSAATRQIRSEKVGH